MLYRYIADVEKLFTTCTHKPTHTLTVNADGARFNCSLLSQHRKIRTQVSSESRWPTLLNSKSTVHHRTKNWCCVLSCIYSCNNPITDVKAGVFGCFNIVFYGQKPLMKINISCSTSITARVTFCTWWLLLILSSL